MASPMARVVGWLLLVLPALACQSAKSAGAADAGATANASSAATRDDDFRLASPPTPAHRVSATLSPPKGDAFVEILGADFPDRVRVKEPFKMRVYFKVLGPVAKDWEVMLHFDSHALRYRRNADHTPMSGAYPTSTWKTGELLVDTKEVTLDRAGQYEAYLSFQLPMQFDRMKPRTGAQPYVDDRLPLGTLTAE